MEWNLDHTVKFLSPISDGGHSLLDANIALPIKYSDNVD